jgi:copper chaperone CopZ
MKNLKTLFFICTALLILSCKNQVENEVEANTAEAVAKTPINPENLASTDLKIEGMTCQMGCANAIESKLTSLSGVEKATVNFENKTATVSYDKTILDTDKITQTIEAVAGGDTYKVVK